jgi:hypothetical protein
LVIPRPCGGDAAEEDGARDGIHWRLPLPLPLLSQSLLLSLPPPSLSPS